MRRFAIVTLLLVAAAFAPRFANAGQPANPCDYPGEPTKSLDSPGTLIGTSGDDVLFGSSGPDIIKGKGGNDIICGNGGADKIDGGTGDDRIQANDGSTVLGRAGEQTGQQDDCHQSADRRGGEEVGQVHREIG